MQRAATIAVIALAAAALAAAPQSAVQKPAPKRSPKDIEADIAETLAQFERKYYPGDVVNPKFRQSMTAEALPLLKKRLALYDEMAALSPAMKAKSRFAIAKTQAKLAYYGDDSGKQALADQATSADLAESTAAKLAQQLERWWEANDQPDEQAKVLDTVIGIGHDQPKNDDVPFVLKTLTEENPASTELCTKAWDAIAAIKTPVGVQFNAVPNKVGKPLAVSGPLLTGKSFNSTQWKGKVILLDFWATWCPPCREEIPRVAKLYADYHDKGFEIVGVNSDPNRADLVAFLKEHPEMPWPQMFVGGTDLHPLGRKFGITGIPTMYLIDRQGVLVTENARKTIEIDLPRLLGESAAAGPAHTPQEEAAMAAAKKEVGVK